MFFRDDDHPFVRSIGWQDVSADQLLSTEQSHVSNAGAPRAWVIDLDSTLLCVADRIRSVFSSFLRNHPAPPWHWALVLPRLNSTTVRYDLERTFHDIFLDIDRAQAASWAAQLWGHFSQFWRHGFFSDRFLLQDRPYPGAVAFVNAVRAQGLEIVYLTARDRPRTGQGTYTALVQAGFPMDSGCHLVMKPDAPTSDLEFKDRAARVLRSRFSVEVVLENEPENLVMFAQRFAASKIVFFHSVMSERQPRHDFVEALQGRAPLRLLSYELGATT